MTFISLPKHLTGTLDLSLYHEDVKGGLVVWLNPPNAQDEGYRKIYNFGYRSAKELKIIDGSEDYQAYLTKLTKLLDEARSSDDKAKREESNALYKEWLDTVQEYENTDKDGDVAEWLSIMLSKGEDKETHFSKDEVLDLIERTKETDPEFVDWICVQVAGMVQAYRTRRKKK